MKPETRNHQKPPLHAYHGVPQGWYAAQIIDEHRRLGGRFNLAGPEATEPGAPSWLPERYEWLQYRTTLYRIADGIAHQDDACVELAVRYIELRYIGSYSGYIRSRLYRRLKQATLSSDRKERLDKHFWSLAIAGVRTTEFKDYVGLWRRVLDEARLSSRLAELARQEDGEAKIAWLQWQLGLATQSAQVHAARGRMSGHGR